MAVVCYARIFFRAVCPAFSTGRQPAALPAGTDSSSTAPNAGSATLRARPVRPRPPARAAPRGIPYRAALAPAALPASTAP